MNLSEWKEQGVVLAQQSNTQKWSLADWLAVGDTAWGGSAYNTAQELFPHLSRKYLMTVAYVGRNVASPLRKDKLSFAHHELVAALEPVEQERALQKALEDGMTVSRLKKYLRDVQVESEFTIPLPKDLFSRLDAFARTVKIAPSAIVARALQLFLANPPDDLAATYQKEIETERERRRLTEERREHFEENRRKEYEEHLRREKEFGAFADDFRRLFVPFESLLKDGGPLKECHSALCALTREQPRPPIATLQSKLSELLALLPEGSRTAS